MIKFQIKINNKKNIGDEIAALGILRFNQWPNFYAFIGLISIIIGVILVNLLGKN